MFWKEKVTVTIPFWTWLFIFLFVIYSTGVHIYNLCTAERDAGECPWPEPYCTEVFCPECDCSEAYPFYDTCKEQLDECALQLRVSERIHQDTLNALPLECLEVAYATTKEKLEQVEKETLEAKEKAYEAARKILHPCVR